MCRQCILVALAFLFTTLDVSAQRRTSLVVANNDAVTWNAGDSFSMLTANSETSVAPMSITDLQNLASGSSISVMIANPSSSAGYIFGCSGTTETGTGSGFSTVSEMNNSASNLSSNSSYVFTLEKSSDTTIRLKNTSGNYLYRTSSSGTTSGHTWSTSTSYVDFVFSQATVTSGLATGYDSNCCLQFCMSNSAGTNTYYWNTDGSTSGLYLSTTNTTSASVWYVYQIISGSAQKFTLTSGEGTSNGEFSGTLTDESATHYALYPYSENNSFDGTNLQFTMPETQTYKVESFGNDANPSAGLYANGAVDFKNLCGLLKLQFLGDEVVTRMEITDTKGANLWGNASIAVSDIGTAGATVSGGSSTIILDCGEGVKLNSNEATPFYIVVPVGAFANGFSAKVVTTEGVATISTTKDQTIKRSVVKKMTACTLGTIEEEIQEFDIENPTAEYYMANSNADFTSNSFLSNSTFTNLRSSAFNNYRCDQPNTKTITFSSTSSTAEVIMATDKDYTDKVLDKTVSLTNGEGSYTLRNFVPGQTYYYKVVDGENILTSGRLKATGQLRMIRIDDSWNIRDLGGWTGWNGNKVRYENIYRGGSLGGTYNGTTDIISEDSQQELQRIGLASHLDLRSMYADKDKIQWVGTTTGAYSLGYSAIQSDGDFLLMPCCWALYHATTNSAVIGALAYVIKEVKAGKPVYFHCRTGADRTGTVGFLIEGLLGMAEHTAGNGGSQLAMDYELTGLSLDEENTIAYNNGTLVSPSYSDRASTGATAYGFFNTMLNSTLSSSITPSNFQEKCYYYVNRYFADNSVSTAGPVYINKTDLDWFINYMLGITDREGNALEGKTLFVGPSWAQDYTDYTLQNAIDNAVTNEFNY